jgi:hypothetical protein
MPCQAFQYTPNVGPMLQLAIWRPGYQPTAALPSPTAVAPPEQITAYAALVDTGASCTCLSAKAIKDVGLNPIGKQLVGGVHGSKLTNQYQFQVVLFSHRLLTRQGQ